MVEKCVLVLLNNFKIVKYSNDVEVCRAVLYGKMTSHQNILELHFEVPTAYIFGGNFFNIIFKPIN